MGGLAFEGPRDGVRLVWILTSIFVALATLAATPAAAAPCVFEPIPDTRRPDEPPRSFRDWGEYVSAPVRGATQRAPMTVAFTPQGQAWLEWSRLAVAPKARLQQRLVIETRLPGEERWRPFCETAWTALERLSAFRRLGLAGVDGRRVRVSIYEADLSPSVTVLDEDRSRVSLQGAFAPVVEIRPEPLPEFDQLRIKAPPPERPCVTRRPPGDARAVTRAALPAGALDAPGAVYGLGGRRAYLRITGRGQGAVKVTLLAKPLTYGVEPLVVCSRSVDSRTASGDEWIVGEAPWESVSTIRWFVRLEADRGAPPVAYELHTDRPAALEAMLTGAHEADVFSCTRAEPSWRRPAASAASMFQGAYALTIRTDLQTMGADPAVRAEVVRALLIGVNNWRVVCVACTPYQFSVVDVDGEVYVPESMLQGQPENYRATFIRDYPWMLRPAIRKNTGLFSSAEPFVRVSGTDRQRSRFCVQDPEVESGFSASESPLCRPTPAPSDQEMLIQVVWRTAGLNCDPAPNVVACWNGTDLIEINARDYSFYAGDIGRTLIGTSPRGVDLIRVFTHEVGHWLGLPHLPSAANIMAARFTDARCIDDLNLARINQVASGEVAPSYAPEALHYE